MMKEELVGKIMAEFVALWAKIYEQRKLDEKLEYHRCKGTKKNVVTGNLTLNHYKVCLFDGKTIYREQMLCESNKDACASKQQKIFSLIKPREHTHYRYSPHRHFRMIQDGFITFKGYRKVCEYVFQIACYFCVVMCKCAVSVMLAATFKDTIIPLELFVEKRQFFSQSNQ